MFYYIRTTSTSPYYFYREMYQDDADLIGSRSKCPWSCSRKLDGSETTSGIPFSRRRSKISFSISMYPCEPPVDESTRSAVAGLELDHSPSLVSSSSIFSSPAVPR